MATIDTNIIAEDIISAIKDTFSPIRVDVTVFKDKIYDIVSGNMNSDNQLLTDISAYGLSHVSKNDESLNSGIQYFEMYLVTDKEILIGSEVSYGNDKYIVSKVERITPSKQICVKLLCEMIANG